MWQTGLSVFLRSLQVGGKEREGTGSLEPDKKGDSCQSSAGKDTGVSPSVRRAAEYPKFFSMTVKIIVYSECKRGEEQRSRSEVIFRGDKSICRPSREWQNTYDSLDLSLSDSGGEGPG